MIDLQTHSTASDGTLSPEALVDLAASLGVTTMALTDHDTVSGIPAAIARGRARGVEVIPGVEFEAEWAGGGHMHILGYFIDHRDTELLERLTWLQERRRERAARILRQLEEAGAPIRWERAEHFAGGESIGRPHIAQALIEADHAKDLPDAFERYLKPGRPGYVEKAQYSSAECIRLIRRSGGVAVLAHPATIKKTTRPEFESVVDRLVGEGIRGIEAYWSKHTPEEMDYFANLARARGLLVTAGSDFHGANKPAIAMGARLEGRGSEQQIVDALRAEAQRALRPVPTGA
jgi:predicted metal-dependent phosphoesterase TrpH